jgi:hypothetical protein
MLQFARLYDIIYIGKKWISHKGDFCELEINPKKNFLPSSPECDIIDTEGRTNGHTVQKPEITKNKKGDLIKNGTQSKC